MTCTVASREVLRISILIPRSLSSTVIGRYSGTQAACKSPHFQFGHMNSRPYNFSFTTGGLLIAESIVVAEVYERCGDWSEAARLISGDNLLQARTKSTARKKLGEIRHRLQMLTPEQLNLLVSGGRTEQLAMLWLAVCKRYSFLHDFAQQVVRELYLSMRTHVTDLHCEDFLDSQTAWHEEIEHLTTTTRRKVCTVALRMLREAEITTNGGLIEPALLSHDVADVITADNRNWFLIFPVAASDIPGAAA